MEVELQDHAIILIREYKVTGLVFVFVSCLSSFNNVRRSGHDTFRGHDDAGCFRGAVEFGCMWVVLSVRVNGRYPILLQ